MLALPREKFLEHLLQTTLLVDLYAEKDPAFPVRALDWLSAIEKTAAQLRHPLASLAAGQRSRALAASDGFREPGVGARVHSGKAFRIAVSAALEQTEAALRDAIAELDGKLDGFREVLNRGLAVAAEENPMGMHDSQTSGKEWRDRVWRELGESQAARGAYLYLKTALGPSDRHYLLDEVRDRWIS